VDNQPLKRTRVLVNKARCKKCGDVIDSRHVHDFVRCGCGAIAVDGGREYLRRVGDPEDCEELSKTEEVDWPEELG
jgi:hypothetical protein